MALDNVRQLLRHRFIHVLHVFKASHDLSTKRCMLFFKVDYGIEVDDAGSLELAPCLFIVTPLTIQSASDAGRQLRPVESCPVPSGLECLHFRNEEIYFERCAG